MGLQQMGDRWHPLHLMPAQLQGGLEVHTSRCVFWWGVGGSANNEVLVYVNYVIPCTLSTSCQRSCKVGWKCIRHTVCSGGVWVEVQLMKCLCR